MVAKKAYPIFREPYEDFPPEEILVVISDSREAAEDYIKTKDKTKDKYRIDEWLMYQQLENEDGKSGQTDSR